MAKPDRDFREDPTRAIYINGDITIELVTSLTPQIHLLRLKPEPITVYITTSNGGSISAAEQLRGLIRMPDQDNRERRMITVVTDSASSAAADLLALGDYAIAYPTSLIHYHGSRRKPDVLTVEEAKSVAAGLQRTNERFALRLARTAFDRVLLAIGSSDGFAAFKAIAGDEEWPNPLAIVEAQKAAVSPEAGALLDAAMTRQLAIRELTLTVLSHLQALPALPKSDAERDIEIFSAVLAYKRSKADLGTWDFAQHGIHEVIADFELLRDYHFGGQRSYQRRLLRRYGPLFLSENEAAAFNALPKEEQAAYLQSHAANKCGALWYYVVSMCRTLQTADYIFNPEEAYWIGLVDEVVGEPDLITKRMLAEQEPAPPIETTGRDSS